MRLCFACKQPAQVLSLRSGFLTSNLNLGCGNCVPISLLSECNELASGNLVPISGLSEDPLPCDIAEPGCCS